MALIDPRVEDLIGRLGEKLGFASLQFDENGACALRFDDGPIVNFVYRPEQQQLLFVSDMGAPPAGSAIYETLLQTNLPSWVNDGTILALSHDEPPHVVVSKRVDWRMDSDEQVLKQLETFIDRVESWTTAIATDPHQSAGGAAPLDPGLFNIRV